MKSWEVMTMDYKAMIHHFRGKVQVTLPSDIWITPAEARQFADDLLKAAEKQESYNLSNGITE